MYNKYINIESIAAVANALKDLLSQMVFVGGAVIGFYVDDPAAEEIRPTDDIDLTIELSGYADWVQMQERLKQLGFSPNPLGHSICSFIYQGISVDIMPTDDGPIGLTNKWYKPGFNYLQKIEVENVKIQLLSLPYFLATKFEAFISRGCDYRTSHDFEDIIYIIDNRDNMAEEISKSDDLVKGFIQQELNKIITNPYIEEIIKSQLNQITADERYKLVLDRIKVILDLT